MILTKKCPIGMAGISKCMGLMAPDGFELVGVDDAVVESVIINKKIVHRMPIKKILQVLRDKVFPFISKGEIIRVDFHVKMSYERIEYHGDLINDN